MENKKAYEAPKAEVVELKNQVATGLTDSITTPDDEF